MLVTLADHSLSVLLAGLQAVLQKLSGYSLSQSEQTQLREQIAAYGQHRIEVHAREAAHTALSRMKDRYVCIQQMYMHDGENDACMSMQTEVFAECLKCFGS